MEGGNDPVERKCPAGHPKWRAEMTLGRESAELVITNWKERMTWTGKSAGRGNKSQKKR